MSNPGHPPPKAQSENVHEPPPSSIIHYPNTQEETEELASSLSKNTSLSPYESKNLLKEDDFVALENEESQNFAFAQRSPGKSLSASSFQTKGHHEEKEENKKCLDPRPQPFGKEKNEYHRTPTFSPDLSSNKSHIHAAQMFEDEGGGDGLASMESDDDDALPCYETLQELLADAEGVKVFKDSLFENEEHALDFWLACNGLNNHSESERKSLIDIIYKTFIKNYKVKIDNSTRSHIKKKVSNGDVDICIFDQAKLEVENALTEGAFRRFIKSEHYVNWLLHSKQYSNSSSPYEAQGGTATTVSSILPTVPEGSECSSSQKTSSSLLTSQNLLATAKYRAIHDKCRTDVDRGSYAPNPYHYTGYVSAINVSLQDSERHSMSSGARTDDNMSHTSGSKDGSNYRRLARISHQFITENAKLNYEPCSSSSFVKNTSLFTRLRGKCPSQQSQIDEKQFAQDLCKRLQDVQKQRDQHEKLQLSIQRIPEHKEDASHQLRKEHAEISMPPDVLQQRLTAEVFHQEDPTQILDEHLARIWDSPDDTPSPPKPKSPQSRLKNATFPHFHPGVVGAYAAKPPFNPKNLSKMGRNQPSIAQMPSSSSALGWCQDLSTSSAISNAGRESLPQLHNRNQLKGHSRRREKGQEIYSTYSIDSGNASEYTHYSSLPKSKSMPEYMENHGGASDGGSSGSRPSSGNRRSLRQSCAENFVDSGVSVVSDSFSSVAPVSLNADRISSWLAQSRDSCGSASKGRSWTSHSSYPYADSECRESQRSLAGDRSTHTLAGSTSPGSQRRSGGGSGRRSQSSSNVPGSTCTQYGSGSLPCQNPASQHYEQMRDAPLKYYAQGYSYEKRKTRGGPSNPRLVKNSSHGDSSGSNGSTMKKQQKVKHHEGLGLMTACSGLGQISGGNPSTSGSQSAMSVPQSESVVAVYNYTDDEVPFTTKIPSCAVTLKKFKQHLPKKGNYRFFFKKVCNDIGVVMAEVTDDAEVLPLYDGRIFAQIRHVED